LRCIIFVLKLKDDHSILMRSSSIRLPDLGGFGLNREAEVSAMFLLHTIKQIRQVRSTDKVQIASAAAESGAVWTTGST
jgi:hypothetical protein